MATNQHVCIQNKSLQTDLTVLLDRVTRLVNQRNTLKVHKAFNRLSQYPWKKIEGTGLNQP